MEHRQTILIVDDDRDNKEKLKTTLENDYIIIYASNKKQALAALGDKNTKISCVLLGLSGEDRNSSDLLSEIHSDSQFSGVPIIVLMHSNSEAEEIRALALGAYDFLETPLRTDVIRHRVAKAINVHETAIMLNMAEQDEMTGLYNRNFFYTYCEWLLGKNPHHTYDIVCMDVDKFKLVNDLYGRGEGDRLISFLGSLVKTAAHSSFGIGCRQTGDTFFIFISTQNDYEAYIRHYFINPTEHYTLPLKINLSFGIYHIDDMSIPCSTMCDRAQVAAKANKNRYNILYGYYDNTMRDKLIFEKKITDCMRTALADEQFEVYLQPKYSFKNGRLAGAEALVRWNHPEMGFLPPDKFIPLFESNGFITALDIYMWNHTCRLIREWRDKFGGYVPVSVNVSRADIYNPEITQVLSDIVEKHGLGPECLNLEITESAYTENAKQLISVVGDLRKRGFLIEMDDFGSGYSSLNMLTELPIDRVKLDMMFVQKLTLDLQKQGVLKFVLSLSHWLQFPVIAEGVETQQQAILLKQMGCDYVQGFYFGKPMKTDRFSELLAASLSSPESCLKKVFEDDKDETQTADETQLADLELISLLDNMPGGVHRFKMFGRKHLDFVSTGFSEMTGYTMDDIHDLYNGEYLPIIVDADREKYRNTLDKLSVSPGVEMLEYRIRRKDGTIIWVSDNFRSVRLHNGQMWGFGVTADITKHRELNAELKLLMNTIPGGLAVYQYSPSGVKTVYFSDKVWKKTGYSREEYSEISKKDPLSIIYQEDQSLIRKQVETLANGSTEISVTYRIRTKCSECRWINLKASANEICGDTMTVNCVMTDVTDDMAENEKLRINEELFRTAVVHTNRIIFRYDIAARTAFLDKNVADRFNISRVYEDMPESVIKSGYVLPDSVIDIRKMYKDIEARKPSGHYKLHICWCDLKSRWIDMQYSLIVPDTGDPQSAVISIADITADYEKELTYQRYRETISMASSNHMEYFDTDLSADKIEKQGGNVYVQNVSLRTGTYTEVIRYIVDNYVCQDEKLRAELFFSRTHLLNAFERGIRNTTEEWRVVEPDTGRTHWFRTDIQLIQDPYSYHIRSFTSIKNITKEKTAMLNAVKQAETDGMTELYNKVTTEEHIRSRLGITGQRTCVLLIADLDGLKYINDNLGHAQGDRAIILMAEMLRTQFRSTDIIGRIGGDEFMVFLEGNVTEKRLHKTLEAFMNRLSENYVGENDDVRLSASIGLIASHTGDHSFEELYAKADKALYYVKRNGKNDYMFYTPDMDDPEYVYTGRDSTQPWKSSYFELIELNRFLKAVSVITPLIISVNLSQNTYYTLRFKNFKTKQCVSTGCFDDLIEAGYSSFHPDDAEDFRKAFSRKSLLYAYEQGKKTVSFTGRQLGDDGIYRMIKTDVIFVEDSMSKDIREITLSAEIP